jgi:hypothetical protein
MFEPREVEIDTVEWPKKDIDRVTFNFKNGSTWSGAKRKDFWKIEDWEKIIKTGSRIKLWTHCYSSIAGFQVLKDDGKWRDVWCALNNFQTKKESEKSDKAYADFIEKEGKRIAKWIDAGKNLKQIDELIARGHSGNTYACALSYGIFNAKNKHNADKVTIEHNLKYGKISKDGVINPAILTIETK